MKQLLGLALSFQLICLPLVPAARAAASNSVDKDTITALQKDFANKNKAAQHSFNQVQKSQESIESIKKELELARKSGATDEKITTLEKRLINLQVFHDEAARNYERNKQSADEAELLISNASKKDSIGTKTSDANLEKYEKEVGSVDPGENEEYDKKAQLPGGFGHYSKQLLGMATSIVGSSIIEQCSFGVKIPSIAAYMAGSITYLVSEITGGQNQNTEQKERLARIEELKKQIEANKGGGDVQRVLLEQRLKEEQDLNDFISERITWLTAVGLMYTVAAGLAIMEETKGIAAGVVASNAACSGVAASTCSGSGPGYPACYAAQYAACVTASPAGYAAANASSALPTSVPTGQAAAASTAIYSPGAMGYLTAYLAGAYAGCTPISVGTVSLGPFSANLISFAYGMGFSLGENSMVGYMKLAIAILNTLIPGLKQLVVAAYNYPIPRAITFGVSAALVAAIIASLKQIKGQTEENITKISKVVDNFKENTTDLNGMQQGGGADDPSNPNFNGQGGGAGNIASSNTNGKSYSVGNNNSITKLNPGVSTTSTSKQCFSSQKGNMSFDSASCSKPAYVKPVSVKVKSGQSTLKTASGLINEIANDLASGDRVSANLKMGQLNAMASNINSEVDKLKTDYNKEQKKNKKDTVNFDDAIAKEMKKYEDLYEQGQNKAIKDQPQLASLARSLSQSTSAALDTSENDATASSEVEKASADSAIALPSGVDLASGNELLSEGVPSEASESFGEDFIFGGDVTTNNPNGLNEDAFRAAMANGYQGLQGKYGAGDGVAGSGQNLFKIISNRYFLSYPKVMKKRIPEAASNTK